MSQHILPGNPPIPLVLRRSARAQRISLRVSRLDGRVTLTLPNRVGESEALDFARDKEDWLRRHLADRPGQVTIGFGATVPFLGEERVIVSGPGRSVQLKPGRVEVPGSEEQVPARLVGFFKQSARGRLAEACDCYSGQLGRDYARLTLRDTRSRWGSCSSRGALMFSWRLVMAPRNVMDYVAAHEVAHLVEMNHSPAFWDVVDDLYGDPTAPRRWLRQNGETLHRYRFGD